MSNFKFPNTMPTQISFLHGEQPSPTKLQGAFQYIQNAFLPIEEFLGNGQDYDTSPLMYNQNVSTSIGSMASVYQPINIFGNLKSIYDKYSNSIVSTESNKEAFTFNYNSDPKQEFLLVNKEDESIFIPFPKVSFPQTKGGSYIFGIIYRYDGTNAPAITLMGKNSSSTIEIDSSGNVISPSTLIALGQQGGDNSFAHATVDIPVGSTKEVVCLKLNVPSGANLKILSLYLIDSINSIPSAYNLVSYDNLATITTNDLECTKSTNIPANLSYVTKEGCTTNINCAYRSDCNQRISSDGCIGNTYDIFVENSNISLSSKGGFPVCFGATRTSDNEAQTYLADSGGGIICQSNLKFGSDMYSLKFLPYAIAFQQSVTLDRFKTVLYHNNSSTLGSGANTLKRVLSNVELISCIKSVGLTDYVPPTVLRLNDPLKWLASNSSSNTSFSIVGGDFGIAQTASKFFELMSQMSNTSTSVYAD